MNDQLNKVLQTFTFPVEVGKVREFAAAILEDNPVYFSTHAFEDPEFRLPLPLTFTQVALFFAPSGSPSRVLGLDYKRLLHGEQEFEYRKPVHAKQILKAVQGLADVYSKPSRRGGEMQFYLVETEYMDEAGDVVIVSRQLLIQLPETRASPPR